MSKNNKKIKYILIFCTAVVLLLICCRYCCGCSNEDNGERNRGIKDTIDIIDTVAVIKPNVNVYIENSGSMDGYVKGVTEFEQTVYGYLSDIKISGIADSLNLYYINSAPILWAVSADDEVINDFIQKLEPSSFKKRGGKRGTSDISDVIKSVLAETQDNEIAILVTDGIFSPGNKDADQFLINQEIGIKANISKYLEKYPNTAVVVYQLFSTFNGQYFNKVDNPIFLNGKRPYYIWIIGQTSNVASLIHEIPKSQFKGNSIAKTFSIVAGNQKVDYTVKANSGNFDKSKKNPKTEILNLKKDGRGGKVKFSVNVNFKNLLLDDDYLTNPDNYELNNYELEVKKINDSGSKYTHSLIFTSDKVRNGELSVKLKAAIPEWVEKVNDDDGSQAVEGKTYGIKYQINGVYDAFTHKTNYYTEIKINIKK